LFPLKVTFYFDSHVVLFLVKAIKPKYNYVQNTDGRHEKEFKN